MHGATGTRYVFNWEFNFLFSRYVVDPGSSSGPFIGTGTGYVHVRLPVYAGTVVLG